MLSYSYVALCHVENPVDMVSLMLPMTDWKYILKVFLPEALPVLLFSNATTFNGDPAMTSAELCGG